MKKLYNKFAVQYMKLAKHNLVVYENGQVFIDCDIEKVISEAEKNKIPFEILKGERPVKPTTTSKKKKDDSTGIE